MFTYNKLVQKLKEQVFYYLFSSYPRNWSNLGPLLMFYAQKTFKTFKKIQRKVGFRMLFFLRNN